jgi:hypothetical protein
MSNITYPANLNSQMILKLTEDHQFVERKKQVAKLVNKWRGTGLLKEIKNRATEENLAQLLENEALHLRKMILSEETSVGNIAGFNKIAFPLVRRVFAQLLANEIVSIQPISLPTGLVFYLDFVTDRAKPGIGSGASVYGDRETVVSPKAQGIGGNKGTGGMYNFDNQIYGNRLFSVGAVADSASAVYSGLTTTSAAISGTLSGFIFTLDSAASVDLMSKNDFRIALSSELVYDATSYSAFRSMTSVRGISNDSLKGFYDRFLTSVSASNKVVIYANTMLTSAASGGSKVVLLGRADTVVTDGNTPTTFTGDFEGTLEMPQLNLKILSIQINAQTKKFKTVWTPELAQDLNAYQSIDAEVELTNILSEQISAEIDREILADLLGAALVKAAWSRKIGKYIYIDSNGALQASTTAGVSFTYQSFHGNQSEWNRTFGEVANGVSNEIYRRNLRGGANWMIVSMQMATVLESMEQYHSVASSNVEDNKFSLGIEKAGTLNTRYTVFKDPYFPANYVLMGYKGKSALENGYVWSPYVPLIVTPTIFSPDNFNPIKGVMTRNAKTIIRNDFYGTITCYDLSSWLGL